MKNTIADRVADFIKNFPPFDLLDKEQLLDISKEVKIKYLDKENVIYNINDPLHDQFYMIYKGAVKLKKYINEKLETIDQFDEGDVFGLRPLFAKENYAINAVTEEETILYCIPIEMFNPFIDHNKKVRQYLIESFASNTENPFSNEFQKKLLDDDVKLDFTKDMFEMQPVRLIKNVITTKQSSSIKDAAKLMSANNVGSIIIEEKGCPIGIITDKDLRVHVATGNFAITDDVSKIMNSPVKCYKKNITIAQAQITMMKHKINQIVVTKDGTPDTKILGVFSEHDIIVMKGTNPSVLMKAIKRSNSTKELKRIREKIMMLLEGYIQQNIPLTHINNIIFELNDATIKRVIERCVEKMDQAPPVKFAWMSIGSQGRKEQLLHTDQDNAIVFENTDDDHLEEVRTYFLTLAKKVNKRLKTIGFEFCPSEMMAKNPKYCLSIDEWENQFSAWSRETEEEELLLCSIFFDFNFTYGEQSLITQLTDHVTEITKGNLIFQSKLGACSLRNPSPLGFFRQFLVEQDGEHKDHFDLKKRAIMPVTDAGRLLAIHYQIININNTAERFEKLAELMPEDEELYYSCAYASKALLKFRTKHGLRHHNSGRFIALAELSKEEKMKLKRCFKAVAKVQELIKLKFNLKNFI
ncbi:CBS domain-containing protein [Formosa sediminum]|uniref:CBS domain-containing protein n=1 Tax=Formosa sediminum TaxID=2594004 RepID=A0A516GTC0_9FLAO|nr:DUF294 nucleotidyltransferase-like domain-containing protein [Formosa sediminum]QDO94764.1 CBS domain-containing protein [Formosa sediminum]